MTTEPLCTDCRHFNPVPGQCWGECKRYPPQVVVAGQYNEVTKYMFPQVANEDHCGEYQELVRIEK